MSSRIRSLAVAAVRQLPTLGVLAALVGLAVWGAANEWKGLPFTKAAQKKDEDKEPPIKIIVEPFARFDSWRRPQLEFPSEEAANRAGIRVAEAGYKEDMTPSVSAPGMVDYDPKLYARLTSRASGTVWRICTEIGEPVRKGDVLALVESATVGKYKADFLQGLTQRKLRQATLDQLRRSAGDGGVPPQMLLQAEADLRQAKISLFNAQQALLNLGLPLRLQEVESLPEERQAEYLRLLGLRSPWWYGYLPLVILDVDVETLTANLLPVTAPFDAVVVQRNVATGEAVSLLSQTGRSLFVVGDVHHLHVDLNVNPADVLKVKLDQTVEFTPTGADAKVLARVAHISPEVDEKTRRVLVHAVATNPDGKLKPNTFGTGRILIGAPHKAVVVPVEALQSDQGDQLHFVFVQLKVSETKFECRLVEPGLRQGGLVEVKGDVRPGDKVVTSGSFALKSELQRDRIAGGD